MQGWSTKDENLYVLVTVLNDVYTCTSSGRRKTSTLTSTWVASKSLPNLMSEPDLEANFFFTKDCKTSKISPLDIT
jgi:hypothetical protein